MSVCYRPLPDPLGAFALAGGWVRFSHAERLERGRAPEIIRAQDIPGDVFEKLTSPRPLLCGVSMQRPCIMGIVNATPDSFSDGGAYDPVHHAQKLAAEGAGILDIGGESTRPGAAEIPAADELARVLPVISAMQAQAPLISVDTRKARVAQSAISAGAGLVNDVSGLDFDPDMAATIASSGAGLCIMHAQGRPETMQDDPRYDDVVLDVFEALEARLARAEAAGIARARICVDPGIGFGKTQAHNLALLRAISVFHGLGVPVLLGVSRKRFIGALSGADEAAQRGPGTLALSLAAIAQGVQIHRVHDVAELAQGLTLWQAVHPEFDSNGA